MIQWMLAIWSLVPLPFLNPALISGSSWFMNCWMKPSLENFEHYFPSVWDVCNCVVIWILFDIAFLWDWNENWLFFQSCGHSWVFQIYWYIECSSFTTSSFRIWNSSAEIPSPPLSLFIVMLLKAHLTSHHRMSNLRWVITQVVIWVIETIFVQFLFVFLTQKNYIHSSSIYLNYIFPKNIDIIVVDLFSNIQHSVPTFHILHILSS